MYKMRVPKDSLQGKRNRLNNEHGTSIHDCAQRVFLVDQIRTFVKEKVHHVVLNNGQGHCQLTVSLIV